MRTAYLAALLIAAAAPAMAQNNAPARNPNAPGLGRNVRQPGAYGQRAGMPGAFGGPRVSGEITRVEGSTLTLKDIQGQSWKVAVPAAAMIRKMDRTSGTFSDLKVGTFVNVMSIAPAGATPPEPGQRTTPMPAPRPGETITARAVTIANPTVFGAVESISSQSITLRLPDNKRVSLDLNAATSLMRGRQAATWSEYKAGENVAVEYRGKTATQVRLMQARMGPSGEGARANPRRDNANRPFGRGPRPQ